MGSKTEGFDILGGVENKSTPLFATLYGFRKSLMSALGISALPMITHNDTKAVLKREHGPSYPYAYFRLADVRVKRDEQNLKLIRRHASSIQLSDFTNATITKGFLFPAELNVEVHWIHNNIVDTVNFVEKIGILSGVDGFSFTVHVPGISKDGWTASVSMDDSPIAIPPAELEDASNPSAYDISFNLTIRTKSGIMKEVPKINNEGTVTRRVGVEDPRDGSLQT